MKLPEFEEHCYMCPANAMGWCEYTQCQDSCQKSNCAPYHWLKALVESQGDED